MTHCLISFLGNSQLQNGIASYREVDYHFPEQKHADRAAFFGFPLQRHIKSDRLIIFGTTGSMWDHLFDSVNVADEKTHELLLEQVEVNATQQETLDTLTPDLRKHLGCEVQLQIVPSAFDPSEQIQLLHMLADAAEGATQLSLDVTHGYRHMPMLIFTAALYLRTLRPKLEISGLWYGYIDGQVSNLHGLLETADWLSALQRHEWLGDSSGIAEQVRASDPVLADELQIASFRESIHQGQQARSNARKAVACLDKRSLTGPGELFEDELKKRLNWVESQRLELRQRRHALDALDRNDFLRASLYGFEAFVTKLTAARVGSSSEKINKHEERKQAQKDFEAAQHSPKLWRNYTLLRGLRNVLAHGNPPKDGDTRTKNAIKNQHNLRIALRESLDFLFNKDS